MRVSQVVGGADHKGWAEREREYVCVCVCGQREDERKKKENKRERRKEEREEEKNMSDRERNKGEDPLREEQEKQQYTYLERIICRELNGKEKDAAFVWAVTWAGRRETNDKS